MISYDFHNQPHGFEAGTPVEIHLYLYLLPRL
jgi:hypothetical protein